MAERDFESFEKVVSIGRNYKNAQEIIKDLKKNNEIDILNNIEVYHGTLLIDFGKVFICEPVDKIRIRKDKRNMEITINSSHYVISDNAKYKENLDEIYNRIVKAIKDYYKNKNNKGIL